MVGSLAAVVEIADAILGINWIPIEAAAMELLHSELPFAQGDACFLLGALVDAVRRGVPVVVLPSAPMLPHAYRLGHNASSRSPRSRGPCRCSRFR